MDHQSRAELEKLLVSLLTEADVRRVVRLLPGGEDMHAELPGTSVSLKELVHQAVSVLERHGRLDGVFFEAVVAERPARRNQIRALAARMPGPTTATPPAPTASPGVLQLATAEARLRYVAAIEGATATRRTLTALTASASASGGVVSLDAVYLPPHLRVIVASDDASAFDRTAGSGDLERSGGVLQDWLCVIRRERKLVTVIGEMGRGKTELMHHVRRELAQMAKEDPAAPLPILVNARELGTEVAERNDLGRAAGKQLAMQADTLRTLLADSSIQWIYLIDGLDEAAPSIREVILALARDPEWRAARVIVTSRPSGVRLDAGEALLALSPWDSEQVDQFLDCWHRVDAATVEALRRSPHYQNAKSALLANPLMATLCLALVKQNGNLPPSRAALLMDLIDILCQGWARERAGDSIQWGDVAPALEQVALQHVRERHPHITRRWLKEALHQVTRHAALELEQATERCFGVLVPLEDGRGYEFLFRGLAEHLAGTPFLDDFVKNGFEAVRRAVYEPWAEEVIRHAIGIAMERGQHREGLTLLRSLMLIGWPWRQPADLWLRPLLIAIRTAADIQKPTNPWARELMVATLRGLLEEESHWVGERVADALQVLAAAGGPITKLLWRYCYERLMASQHEPEAWYAAQGERNAAWWLRALRHRDAKVRAVACERLAAHVNDHEVREQLVSMLFDGWGLGVAPALVAGATLRRATRDTHFVESIRETLLEILEGGGQFSAGGAALALRPDEAEPKLLARALAMAYQGTREILDEPVHELAATPHGREALEAEWPQWRDGLVETWRYRTWIPELPENVRQAKWPPLSQQVRRRVVRAFATGLAHLDSTELIAAQARHMDSIDELCRAAYDRPADVLPYLRLKDYRGPSIPVDAQRNLGRAATRHREVRDALLAAWDRTAEARPAADSYPGVALERLVLEGDEEAIEVYAAWLPVSPYTWPFDFPSPDPAVFTVVRIKEVALAEARYVWDYATLGQVKDGERSWLAPQTTATVLHHLWSAWIEDAALVSGLCQWLDGQDDQKRLAAAWALVGGPVVPGHVRPLVERVLVEFIRGYIDTQTSSTHDVRQCLRAAERLGLTEMPLLLTRMAALGTVASALAAAMLIPALPTSEARALSGSIAATGRVPGGYILSAHQLRVLVQAAPEAWISLVRRALDEFRSPALALRLLPHLPDAHRLELARMLHQEDVESDLPWTEVSDGGGRLVYARPADVVARVFFEAGLVLEDEPE